jgi:HEPN domain-containing protein
MRNDGLTRDYLTRAGNRLAAVRVLLELESWADVVRESQELVEITLKALLRAHRIDVPRIHDVSPVMEQNREVLAPAIGGSIEELTKISRALRRDRELAFYGSEDLTPSEFYKEEDANTAFSQASLVYRVVSEAVGADSSENE